MFWLDNYDNCLLKELALEGSDFSLVLQLPCVQYALDPPVYLTQGSLPSHQLAQKYVRIT